MILPVSHRNWRGFATLPKRATSHFAFARTAVSLNREASPRSSKNASNGKHCYPSPSGWSGLNLKAGSSRSFHGQSTAYATMGVGILLVSAAVRSEIPGQRRYQKQEGTLTCKNHSQSWSLLRPLAWRLVATRTLNAASRARRSGQSAQSLPAAMSSPVRPSAAQRASFVTTSRRSFAAKASVALRAAQVIDTMRAETARAHARAVFCCANTGRGTPCSRRS